MSQITHGEGIGTISISLPALKIPEAKWEACANKAVTGYAYVVKAEVGPGGWLRIKTSFPFHKSGDDLTKALAKQEDLIIAKITGKPAGK